mmetsp:Transcript_16559/g.35834  ORF Transcript_16559/g.35834 Transcript_16559/m.35834 type:complete len:229 (+) Transcript_16559:101-787(+)|eukprot:CAMPEP_0202906814 /NCGR_PEP_ID=MMETSP1392-20130828/40382_1 /ASSEMBLY_ACC=CAM_ASM_000868 /TAXON_ID=225041 /ORGANISM="Chlamydomonas chlamydogama, Strain SAG 11-48b" /LENGTH=228 /DNA_ID=CAMNT_0049595471 /DNA_START=88 /DNA_END=774 /DNA_ORIENTATION=-
MAEAGARRAPESVNECGFLPDLVKLLRLVISEGGHVSTADFTKLMDHLITVFDYLGTVLHFAKHDMLVKNDSLKAAALQKPTLKDIVDADKAAGTVTTKNSCARNLHRLTSVIAFTKLLLEKLTEAPSVTVKDAGSFAYEKALAPIHPYVVRTAVWAGMYLLPTREAFMQSIGETNETAKPHVMEFISCAASVIEAVEALYDAPMPASESALASAAGGGGWFGWGASK